MCSLHNSYKEFKRQHQLRGTTWEKLREITGGEIKISPDVVREEELQNILVIKLGCRPSKETSEWTVGRSIKTKRMIGKWQTEWMLSTSESSRAENLGTVEASLHVCSQMPWRLTPLQSTLWSWDEGITPLCWSLQSKLSGLVFLTWFQSSHVSYSSSSH